MGAVDAKMPMPGLEEEQKLETFIDQRVRPTTLYMNSLLETVDKVVRYLHGFDAFVPGEDYRVKEVVKSGSTGKGTAVNGKADVDLIVFLQKYRDMAQFLKELPRILGHLRRYVAASPDLELDQSRRAMGNRYMVKCFLRHGDERHQVDILPAVDMIANVRSLQTLYEEMSRQTGSGWEGPRSHYSVCLAKIQRDFVKNKADHNAKIKDLIKLVKYWSKEHNLATVSYCLELVCIATWQEYDAEGGDRRFKMTMLFWRVLQKLKDLENIRIAFHEKYQPTNYPMSPPYVRDPANPFNNTLPWDRNQRRLVEEKARYTLDNYNTMSQAPQARGCCVM